MSFPDDPLGLEVELYYDYAWRRVTTDTNGNTQVLGRDPISITAGRANESQQISTSTLGLTLNNRNGKFSPRNPTSGLYGKIGRNTPIKVLSQGETDQHLALYTTTPGASTASTPDTAALDITGDIDIRIQFESSSGDDLGAHQVISKQGVSADSWELLYYPDQKQAQFQWSTTGVAMTHAVISAEMPDFAAGVHQAMAVTMDVNDGAGNKVISFFTAPVVEGPYTLISTTTSAGTTSIFSSTSPLTIGGVQFAEWAGRVWAAEVRNGILGTLVANPDFRIQAVGATSFADSAGRTWTVNSGAAIENLGLTPRFTGEVSSWPTKWDTTGTDVWTSIEAAGVMRRLEQGTALPSPGLKQFYIESLPYDYWALDDGEGSTTGTETAKPPRHKGYPVYRYGTGTSAAFGSPLSFGTGDLGENFPPGLEIHDTGTTGYVRADIGSGGASVTSWALDFVYKSEVLGPLIVRARDYGDPQLTWQLEFRADGSNDDVRLSKQVASESGAVTTTALGDSAVLSAITDAEVHHCRLQVTEDGADTDWAVYVDGTSVASGTASGVLVNGVSMVTFSYDATGTDTSVALGHLAFWQTPGSVTGGYLVAPDITNAYLAFTGYVGETAGARIERLCDEAGIVFQAIGDMDTTALMGPQDTAAGLAAMREAADTDMGLLYEARDFLGLVYRARTDLYNQAPTLELDYALNHLGAVPDVIDDDDTLRNDWTVSRSNGGQARATLLEGPLSVQAPPDGVGRYDTEVSLSLASDAQLEGQAFWRLHMGTVDEARIPRLTLDMSNARFVASAALSEAASVLSLGDLVTVENPPAWLPPDTVQVLAQGFTETLSNFTWIIDVNCSPAVPWRVAQLGPDDPADNDPDLPNRCDTIGTELQAGFNSTHGFATLVTTLGPVWVDSTNYPDEFPFDIKIGGEIIRVTAISGTTSPQTATITRSINGVVKAHTAGDPVSLAYPMIVAL